MRSVLSGEEPGTESDRVDSGRFDEDREGDSDVSVREVQGRERGARAPPHVRTRFGGVGREEERLESDEGREIRSDGWGLLVHSRRRCA